MASLERESRMPAEWELHERVWIGFPSRKDTWRRLEDGSCPAQAAFAELAALVATRGGEKVSICASSADVDAARQALRAVGLDVDVASKGDKESTAAVTLHEIEQDDSWFRDTGPCFCVSPGSAK